jgi:hydroxyacylglutathione hydrolase
MKYHIVTVTPFMQNCSILVCPETQTSAIIDPGGDPEKIINKINTLNATPQKVFLTHAHMDHVGAAQHIARHYNIPIEGSHLGDKDIFDTLPLWCQQVSFPHVDSFHPDKWLNEGDTITFGAQKLSVFHCPGHTPGHVVFYHKPTSMLWVGDVIFKGSIGRTDFPGGDHNTLINSIKNKLWHLGDQVTFVSGHGPLSTIGYERETNPFVADSRFG